MTRPGAAPSRLAGVVAAVAAFVSFLPTPLAAQDVAPPARGVVLPAAYFDRLATDPTAFRLPNGLFRVGAAGEPACACFEGWAGELCDEALCPADCSGKGQCVSPGVCRCSALWTGPLCDTPRLGGAHPDRLMPPL